MPTPQAQVVEILVAKTHFSKAAAEVYVAELNDADLAALIECDALPNAKAHINSYLDLLAAKKAADDKGVASATAEFVAGVKASQPQKPPALSEAPVTQSPVALPAAEAPAAPPVSQETTQLRKSKRG